MSEQTTDHPEAAPIPELYQIETIEQVRAIADQLRIRIIDHLTIRPMTVTQLAELIGVAPNKLHYHVRELERVGLLRQVETRERGGILEKYYRSIARCITIPTTLLRTLPPDGIASALQDVTQSIFQGVLSAANNVFQEESALQIGQSTYWMTKDELEHVRKGVEALLQPYQERRAIEHEKEQTIVWMAYTNSPENAPLEPTEAPRPVGSTSHKSTEPARHHPIFVIGVARLDQQELKIAVAHNEVLDIYIFGSIIFAADVTSDLIDQAVATFHLWGKLNATSAVSAALEKKKAKATK